MARHVAFGTSFEREGVTPGQYEKIANVIDISGPSLARETVDVSDQDSTDRWREYMATMRDAGEVTFGLHFDPAGASHEALLTDFQSDSPKNYRLVFPDGTTWSFAGFITAFSPNAPFADKLTADVTVKVSGKPTFGTP